MTSIGSRERVMDSGIKTGCPIWATFLSAVVSLLDFYEHFDLLVICLFAYNQQRIIFIVQ